MKNIHDGDRVRTRLAQMGLTQREFADKIGVAASTLSRMLHEASWRTDYLKSAGDLLDTNFFKPYFPAAMDSGPIMGILIKPDCIHDPDIFQKARYQIGEKP